MQISDFPPPANVLSDVRAATKDQLLRDLSKWVASACGLDPSRVCDEIAKRERLGSTGMGEGIAIPHTRLEGLGEPFGILACLAKAIDFAAIDGRPVDLVFFLLLPAKTGRAIEYLIEVAIGTAVEPPKSMETGGCTPVCDGVYADDTSPSVEIHFKLRRVCTWLIRPPLI